MAGALKTLYTALAASASMTGVNLVFGEENVNAQEYALPMVVMAPVGGQYSDDGYEGGGDVAVEHRWKIQQQVDLYLWAEDTNPTALPIDHADAVETLRQKVLSAFQDQRAQYTDVASVAYGLSYVAVSERWAQMERAFSRFGRALVITVNCEITVDTTVGQEATITSYQLSKTLTLGPS